MESNPDGPKINTKETKETETEEQPFPVGWCEQCQANKTFINGFCVGCTYRNAHPQKIESKPNNPSLADKLKKLIE